MRHYGIIGNPVEQSFSARYFTEKFEKEHIDAEYARYRCVSMDDALLLIHRLDGFNVTIPHKQAVMPHLDELDQTAKEIGAVNVVKVSHCDHGDKTVGYNTDCIGFISSIRPSLLPTDKKALILGTGGAARAVLYGLRQLGLDVVCVSRQPNHSTMNCPCIGYDALTEEIMTAHSVIVNCTPVGMWPNVAQCPSIPYDYLQPYHLLYDCIYNPQETEFLSHGKKHGARIINGMNMLIGQAVAAWEIWNNN